MPPLTVLPAAPPAADPVRLFDRVQLQRSRAVAEEVRLDGGTWLHNVALQPLAVANCVLDAAVDAGGDPAAVVAEVEAASAGCPVQGWTLNPSLPADRTAPLAGHLGGLGRVPDPVYVLLLRQLSINSRPPPELTVIPARAAYGPLRRLLDERFAGDPQGALKVEAAELALDDSHLDGWVAMRGGAAVGLVHLLNDGETGAVTDLYVTPAQRRGGIGRHLLWRALEAGGRAGHRHVVAGVRPGGTGLFAAAGFAAAGRWVQYVRR